MPVRKVPGGFKYGTKGRTYKTRAAAERQGRAIQANKARKASPTPRFKGRRV